MVDVSQTIQAKSDQLNADDLIGGKTITVTITAVKKGDAEQPIVVHFDGDNGRPYKPGKSMRRVMVGLWGPNGDDYVGRSMTLYRDPEVEFGKVKVGGVRISEMSHLDGSQSMPLTIKRGAKAMFNVRALKTPEPVAATKPKKSPEEQVASYVAGVNACASVDDLIAYQSDDRRRTWIDKLKAARPDLHEQVVAANVARGAALSPTIDDDGLTDDDDDPFADDPAVGNPGEAQ